MITKVTSFSLFCSDQPLVHQITLDELIFIQKPIGRYLISGTVEGFIKCLLIQPSLEYGHEYSQVLILTHQHFVDSVTFLKALIKM